MYLWLDLSSEAPTTAMKVKVILCHINPAVSSVLDK